MKRFVASTCLLIALLPATGSVSGVVFRRHADHRAEAHRGSIPGIMPGDRALAVALDQTFRPATCAGGVETIPHDVLTIGKCGSPGNQVPFVGTERYVASVHTQRDGQCLPTRAGASLATGLSAARRIE